MKSSTSLIPSKLNPDDDDSSPVAIHKQSKLEREITIVA